MSVARARGVVVPLVAAFVVALTAGVAQAQNTTITGKVVDQYGSPIPGANVSIRSLNLGAIANQTGGYTIVVPEASATGQQVLVNARFIGYQPADMPVTLTTGAHSVNFTLKTDPFQLNAVVVTGVADSTSAKNLSFSVAHVDGQQVKDVPGANPIVALAGKVAGAKIELGTGNPGATPAIRLRGSTSLQSGESTPLIVVDGVITTEGIADIDANDIASIEVLKGAAGASFYGSNAANGVINIKTKRGASLGDGAVSVTARSEYGQSGIGHWPGVNHGTRQQFNPDGTIQLDPVSGNPVTNTSGFDDTPYPTSGPNMFRNQLKAWMQNNTYYSNDVSLGVRRGKTNFAGSFTSDHNGGILPFKTGQFRQNARLNVDQSLSDRADLSASVTYGQQKNDYDPNGSQAWFALYQAPPDIDLRRPYMAQDSTIDFYPMLPAYADPSARGNPIYDLVHNTYGQNRQRILASVSGRYRPTDWLRLEANYGTDRLSQRVQTYTERGALTINGTPGTGSLRLYSDNDISWNSQLRATATKLLFGDLLSVSSAAYQMENVDKNSFDAGGNRLTVNQVPDLAAIDKLYLSAGSYSDVERTTDYMLSQSLTYRDRYIVDGLYRRDGSSLFGADSRWSDFYRVSGAYRLTQDFQVPGFQEIKLHAARGTAGLRPKYWYQYETYSISGGSFSRDTKGNKNLKPAVLTESEYGINADFLGRFSAEVNYADRLTKGAFLQVPISSAAQRGFTSQWQNAADISSKTLEGLLQVRVLDRRDFSYDLSLTGDHTTQAIDKMNRPPFRVSADGAQGQNVFWYEAGKPLGIIYGTKYVHNFAELQQNPAYANANPSDYVVNPLGYLVLAANRGTRAERPIVYSDATGNNTFVIGNVNPKMNFGVGNDIRWGKFNVHAQFDGQMGGNIYNFSKQWTFQDLRAPDMDMTGKPDNQKIAEDFFTQGLYNGLNASEYFVEPGGYLKLRELSVGYTVAPKYLSYVGLSRMKGAKLALIGRNLMTWTKYSGFDPDVTSASDFNYRIDGFRYPPFRTITGQVQFEF